jgi:putative endonuclease
MFGKILRRATGTSGEDDAAAFLRKKGLRILERNFRTRYGEIDIVARDGESVVFVEVKARSAGALAEPKDAVDAKKRKRIIMAAREHLSSFGEARARFDVVSIRYDGDGKPSIEHLENAFEDEF